MHQFLFLTEIICQLNFVEVDLEYTHVYYVYYLCLCVSFTSRAKGCITFVPHSCLVFLSPKVGVFLEELMCYFIGTGYEYDDVFVAWVLQVRRAEVVTK